MQPGMLCAGYANGDHDTCQVQNTVQFIIVITVVIIYHARSSKTLESEVEKNTTKQSPITNYNLNEKQSYRFTGTRKAGKLMNKILL